MSEGRNSAKVGSRSVGCSLRLSVHQPESRDPSNGDGNLGVWSERTPGQGPEPRFAHLKTYRLPPSVFRLRRGQLSVFP